MCGIRQRISCCVALCFAFHFATRANAGPTEVPPATQPAFGTSDSAKSAFVRYRNAIDEENRGFEHKISQLREEYAATVEHARKAYLASLRTAMSEETKKGELDSAVAIRGEITKVEAALSLAWPAILPVRDATAAPQAPSDNGSVSGGKNANGPADIAAPEALGMLTPQQRAVAAGLHFSRATADGNEGHTYGGASIHVTNLSPVGQVTDKVRSRTRLLCINADGKPVVLEVWSDVKIGKKGDQVLYLGGIENSEIRFNNADRVTPQNAEVVIYLADVPIYQGVWKAGGTVRWWDDNSLVKKH